MTRRFILTAVTAALLAAPIAAQDTEKTATRFGLRAGFGIDPDQFVIGGQSILGRAAKILKIGGSFDVGLGDDVTTFCLNGDLMLDFPVPSSPTTFYVLAGPTLVLFDQSNGDSDSEIGLSIGGGLRTAFQGSSRLYTLELRAGIGDIPEGRVLAGVFF